MKEEPEEKTTISHLNWETEFRLGDLCSIKHGYAFKSKFMTTRDIDYLPIILNIVNFRYTGGFRFNSTKVQRYVGDYPSEYKLKPGDILLIMTCQTAGGEILGVPGRIPNDDRTYLHNQRMGLVVLKDPQKATLDFLYWLFLSPKFNHYLYSTATGAKILHTAPDRIENFRFQLPPLLNQRKIAAILSAYDDLIENNLQRIQILEEMARTIYREWFIDFRFPGHEKVQMIDSPLGKIPEEWEVRALREVSCLIKRGISPIYDNSSPSIVINQKCIRNFRLDLSKSRRHRRKVPSEKFLLYGDILINSTGIGTLGRVAQVQREISDCTVDSHVTIVRPKDDEDPEFFGLQLFNLQSHLERQGVGTTGQAELGREIIADIQYLRPPRKLQAHFSKIAKPMRTLAVQLHMKNDLLRCTRDLLLPKLISGELDVSGLDIDILGENT